MYRSSNQEQRSYNGGSRRMMRGNCTGYPANSASSMALSTSTFAPISIASITPLSLISHLLLLLINSLGVVLIISLVLRLLGL
jgi:hypothetical protein